MRKENTVSFKSLKQYYSTNPYIKECIKYLEDNYKIFEGAQYSYNQFKNAVLSIVSKLQSLTKSEDDKYNQKGFIGILKKLKNIIIKICDRIISMITSIGFQPVFVMIGLYTTQSVVITIIASSIYWVLCLVIKKVTADTLKTNKWYEPNNFLKTQSLKSSIGFINTMKLTIYTTAKDIFNWFFIELEDEKSQVKFKRRILLLTLIVLLFGYMVA